MRAAAGSTSLTSSQFEANIYKDTGTSHTGLRGSWGGNSTSRYQPGTENLTSIYQSRGLERNGLSQHDYGKLSDVEKSRVSKSDTETKVYQTKDESGVSSESSRSIRSDLEPTSESLLTSFYQPSSDAETSIYQVFCSNPDDNEIVTSIKSSLFSYMLASSSSFLDEDSFIPFDPPIVSKFGPISRTARAKLKCSDPVHVTAESDCLLVTPVTAVTPTARPYPVSVQTPSRFSVEKPPSSLRKEAKPFAMLSMPRVSAKVMGPSSVSSNQPYTLWESGYHQPLSRSSTIQERLQHELARVEHQIHVRENSTRELSQHEKLQCELQAIEQQISMKTGKPPNASLEMNSHVAGRSRNMRVVVPKLGSLLDADIDLNTALTPEEEQELNELHLSVQTSRRDNECGSPTD